MTYILGIEVDGTLEFVDNVFTGTAAVDFVDVLTDNQPNDAFTFVSINLKEMLGDMGITGDVEIVQTNPALSFAYGSSAFPANTKTKTYTLASILTQHLPPRRSAILEGQQDTMLLPYKVY